MEATPATSLPEGPQWQYEPKWDGFRCLAFRDNKRIDLQSKSGKPLTRYFPELVEAVGRLRAIRCVLDGEIVIPVDGDLSFDELLMRIHPSATRVEKLSRETPCLFIIFDLLVDEKGKSLKDLPLQKRRQELDRFAAKYLKGNRTLRLSPFTLELSAARKWFHMGTAVDGVVAKRRDLSYQSGTRNGMEKIKKLRTTDCVVGGFRYLEKEPLVGSLLLGLYNKEGELDHVGFSSSIQRKSAARTDAKITKADQAARFHRQSPRRTESMEQQAFLGVAASPTEACGGSAVRSFHWGSVSPWHEIPPLAP
jgi:ATP-dependent DNA ligase